LRGTPLDPFGHTRERKGERALRDRYLAFARDLPASLRANNKDAALKLAQSPDQVRGYGHIKQAAMDKLDGQWPELLARYRSEHIIELKRGLQRQA
jgi:indolepyruvate ferredoxin oxidoreductase